MNFVPHKRVEVFKPPKFVMRAATSTLSKAASALIATQNRLIKLQQRRDQSSESIMPASTVDELTSEVSRTVSNTETTSSGSAYTTSFSSRATTVKVIGELPKPSCRLGSIQVEWDGDEVGWRLIELDSVADGDENLQLNSNDKPTLRRVNSKLKKEQKLLKLKIEILLNTISEQTALVSMNEETLTNLRAKAKLAQQAQDVSFLSPKLPSMLPTEEKKAKSKRRSQSEPRGDGKMSSKVQMTETISSTKHSLTETETFTEAETEISTAAPTVTPSSTVKLTKTVQFAQ